MMAIAATMSIAGSVCAQSPSPAAGQAYPNKAIRIVTAEPGGGADLVARITAQGLTGILGQQVIVENRGGSAVIPAEIVAKAPADGYTLSVSGNTTWLLPFLQANVPYSPLKDFAMIVLTTSSPAVLAVHPSVAAGSVKDVIALAKAKPGELNFASGTLGSTTQLATELFRVMAGINIVRVPYKGAGPALAALVAGQVQFMFFPASTGTPMLKAGKVKGIAVASAQPTALAPGLPTVSASGLPGYESGTFHVVFAPARTPEAIITRLNQEIVRYINRAEIKDKLFGAGLDIVGTTSRQSAATMKAEMERMGKVIKEAGLKAE
jgi:tripartite-type tricarboxylate transporter receptor subunit TctC